MWSWFFENTNASVAQLDRANGFYPVGYIEKLRRRAHDGS